MLETIRTFFRTRFSSRAARWSGYALFFSFSFLLFAYWSFPYDRLRDYVVEQVEYPVGPDGERRASGWELEIVDLRPSWFTGVALKGVRLAKPAEDPDDRPFDLAVERLDARISLLPLLWGTRSVGFGADVAGGTLDGHYTQSAGSTGLMLDMTEINLRHLTILRGMVGIPITGVVTGTVDLTVAEDVAQTKGVIDVGIASLGIGDGQAKLKVEGMGEGLTIDRIEAGNLRLKSSVEAGNAKIEELKARGTDAEVDGSGSIRLATPLRNSRLDLTLRLKFHESYQNKSERTRALFSLMDFNPRLRAAKTPDGALQWRILGSMGTGLTTTAAGRM